MGQDRNNDSKDKVGRDRDRVDSMEKTVSGGQGGVDRIEGTGWLGADTVTGRAP